MRKESTIIKLLSMVLILFGLIIIYSSSYVWSGYKFNNGYHYVLYQFIFLLISLFISRLIIKMNLNIIKKHINKLLLLGIILLLLVIIPGVGVVRNGSRSWFSIGPLSMQPSEFIKIILIIFTAKYLEKYHYKINKIKDNLSPLIIVLSIIIFLIMLEPDFGSSMIIILTILSMIFISGLKYKFFNYIGMFGFLGIVGIIIVAPYRMARIISFINPWKDPLGSGYQIIQSLYAIGPGGLFGHGFFSSIQKYFYLPEPQTDFIFAIFCEEFGFILSAVVIIIFLVLFYNIYKVSISQSNLFNKFVVFGILSNLVIQTVMNLSVVVGLIPVTGVTLPFFSYGGSSLLITIIEISIIINIINNKI